MILGVATMVASLVLAVWPLVVLRRWTRLPRGELTLRNWGPALAVPAQGVVAFLWLVMLVDLPWTFYVLYWFLGSLWFIPAKLALSLVFVLIPGGLIILDAAWLRVHPIPPGWTLSRIWGMTGAVWLSTVVLGALLRLYDAVFIVLLLFTTVAWIFLTLWWVASHPLPSD
jgi:hypothetical protein